jgi:hypothetical protein
MHSSLRFQLQRQATLLRALRSHYTSTPKRHAEGQATCESSAYLGLGTHLLKLLCSDARLAHFQLRAYLIQLCPLPLHLPLRGGGLLQCPRALLLKAPGPPLSMSAMPVPRAGLSSRSQLSSWPQLPSRSARRVWWGCAAGCAGCPGAIAGCCPPS